jgi:cobalt-precorrin-5B (C1)-methyltransferase
MLINQEVGQLKAMRWGYSTGTCAAAASKAALIRLLNDKAVASVRVKLPDGRPVEIPVAEAWRTETGAIAEIIKDAGDDPDVTNGISIFAEVQLQPGPGIVIQGGAGVGMVTKPGLAVAVGEAAINPVPRSMIERSLRPLLPPGQGLLVTISAPDGQRLATQTLNPRLGIAGGISILGTTGLVRPMSQEAYLDSLIPQINQAVALGYHTLVFTPGGMGAQRITEMGVPADAVVQTSNFVGQMLDAALKRRVKRILLFGHIGKLIKVSAGIFQTHSKVADARRETMAAHLALLGAQREIIAQVMTANTIDAILPLVQENGMEMVYEQLAAAASRHCQQRSLDQITVGTAMYALDGALLGYDQAAAAIGRRLGWKL